MVIGLTIMALMKRHNKYFCLNVHVGFFFDIWVDLELAAEL
jgi:hypothetical protein